MKTIKVFLASSEELKDEREKFGNFIRRLDDLYLKRGIHDKRYKCCHLDYLGECGLRIPASRRLSQRNHCL